MIPTLVDEPLSPINPISTDGVPDCPLAMYINGSSTLSVAVLTVTVSPLTVKLPAIVTSSGNPIVIVPLLSATVTSSEVPANVIVPPKEVAVVLVPSETVIAELLSLALAIEPAKCSLSILPST